VYGPMPHRCGTVCGIPVRRAHVTAVVSLMPTRHDRATWWPSATGIASIQAVAGGTVECEWGSVVVAKVAGLDGIGAVALQLLAFQPIRGLYTFPIAKDSSPFYAWRRSQEWTLQGTDTMI
jgi:hypothetical protein